MRSKVETTGIGSLPFLNVKAAVEHVFTNYTLPFFPQLVRLADTKLGIPPMLAEVLTPTMRKTLRQRDARGFCAALESADEGAAADLIQSLPGFKEFSARVSGRAKAQVAGPMTVLAILESTWPDLPDVAIAVWSWIRTLSKAWVKLLRGHGATDVLLVWDDALLHVIPSGQSPRRGSPIASLDARLGVHVCAPSTIEALASALPGTVLCVDLNVVDASSAAAQAAVKRHIATGGSWIFGVADTRTPNLDLKHTANLMSLAESLTAPGSPLIVSGGCGTGLHTEEFERHLAAVLRGMH